MEGNGKFLFGVALEILFHQLGREAVKTCINGSVRGEKISSSRYRQRQLEWLFVFQHV
jgi:hypothetical protein